MENIENYEVSETRRGKNKLLLTESTNSIFHIKRCTHHKTDYKCKSYIILNDKNKIIKYYNNHNHLEEYYNATMSLLKHEINKSIKDETSLGMKPKLLYNKHFQKIGKYCPNYISVRTQMMRTINKQYPSNIKTFNEILDESKFFKTVRDDNFKILNYLKF
ncbi:hypothetical protein PIROE2DRAFT_6863 [Piromyces sp. E2]|nr:hypothetical protein PIROE2DRAFT_6863 [Piromyces sp. E2]|eukprot:OUM66061.1 hypothetical protein PIROE2DRAFT_6863 [Piromyces sp. E2]